MDNEWKRWLKNLFDYLFIYLLFYLTCTKGLILEISVFCVVIKRK